MQILETDKHAKYRAWAAASLMQMFFRRKNERKAIYDIVLPVLRQAILREEDAFALGSMITAVQEIAGKSFRLSSASVRRIDVDKIEKAKKSAIRFFIQDWRRTLKGKTKMLIVKETIQKIEELLGVTLNRTFVDSSFARGVKNRKALQAWMLE